MRRALVRRVAVLAQCNDILRVHKQIRALAWRNQVVDDLRRVLAPRAAADALAYDIVSLHAVAESLPKRSIIERPDSIIAVAFGIGGAP